MGKGLFHHIRPESSISSSNLTRFLYLITFATTYGSAIWMTFVSGVILSKSIPRQQFGFVQSRIFPLYLKFVAMGDVILLVLYSIMHPLRSTDSSGVWQLVNLVLLIIGTVFNVFILEPKTTKVQRRMPSFAYATTQIFFTNYVNFCCCDHAISMSECCSLQQNSYYY